MSVFNLPDLGEGLPDAEIVEWHVKVGDTVEVDQPMVSMETAKAVVDVPVPTAGIVKKLYGEPGDVIDTGAPLIEFDTGDGSSTAEADSADTDSDTPAKLRAEAEQVLMDLDDEKSASQDSDKKEENIGLIVASKYRRNLDQSIDKILAHHPDGSISSKIW